MKGLRIHQGKARCRTSGLQTQRTDIAAGETQEDHSQESTHSAEDLSVSDTSLYSAPSQNVANNPQDEDEVSPPRKEEIAWPNSGKKEWASLDEDLRGILIIALQGNVEKRLETMTTIIYNVGKERFGTIERKKRTTCIARSNRREAEIRRLRQDIKELSRQYRRSSEEERTQISQLTNDIRERLIKLRQAESTRRARKRRAKARSQFVKNPFQFTKKLLGQERSGSLESQKTEVEEYLKDTHSDPDREADLGHCPKIIPLEEPRIPFNCKEPSWKEVKEVVRKARGKSSGNAQGRLLCLDLNVCP